MSIFCKLHVKGLSSWWISSKIQFCLVCVRACDLRWIALCIFCLPKCIAASTVHSWCVCVYHLDRCKTSHWLLTNLQGGAEHSGDCTQRSYPLVLEAESDQLCVPAEFGLNCWTSCHVAALLSQSGINVGHLRLVQLHQNLPQYFRRTMSPTVFLIFGEYFAEPCRRCIWMICQNHVADVFYW